MIGILTFYWADDYGAMLQSYSLKTYLDQYEDTILIPYFPRPLRSRYALVRYNRKARLRRRVYEIGTQILSKSLGQNIKSKYRMCCFRKKYLTGSCRRLSTSKDICKFGRKIDTYVVGSDQVWNPEITEGFQEGYFCTFRLWNRKRARYTAYAASIGKERLEKRYDKNISQLLQNFDAISMREVSSVLYIESLWNKKVAVVMDPVFLLKRNQWTQLVPADKKRRKKYIAVYSVEQNPMMLKYLEELEKRAGYEICTAEGGPLEFLELLYYAEYVVTNSFHGVAMSIIFHKQFLVFSHSTRGVRMENLLGILHLQNRMADRPVKAGIDEPIDWESVDAAIKTQVAYSKRFIQKEILAHHRSNS